MEKEVIGLGNRVTRFGEELDRDLYTLYYDSPDLSFTCFEDNLKLDFYEIDNCRLEVGNNCIISGGNDCVFRVEGGSRISCGSGCVILRRDVHQAIHVDEAYEYKLELKGIKGYRRRLKGEVFWGDLEMGDKFKKRDMENRIKVEGVWYVREKLEELDLTIYKGCVWEDDECLFEATLLADDGDNDLSVEYKDKLKGSVEYMDNPEYLLGVYNDCEESRKLSFELMDGHHYDLFRSFLHSLSKAGFYGFRD